MNKRAAVLMWNESTLYIVGNDASRLTALGGAALQTNVPTYIYAEKDAGRAEVASFLNRWAAALMEDEG